EVRDFDSIIEERKFAEVGSFATLLGFDIYGLDGPEPHWRGVALGDTVLFHVRAGHLIATFPPMGPEDFGTLPDGVHTSPASLDRMTGRLLSGGGVLEAGDFLFAATDAMAQWSLRTIQRREPKVCDTLTTLAHPAVFQASAEGRAQALRCYIREDASSRDRYSALDAYLAGRNLSPYVSGTTWLDGAITVNRSRWPVLTMDWIDGRTLNEYVDFLVT